MKLRSDGYRNTSFEAKTKNDIYFIKQIMLDFYFFVVHASIVLRSCKWLPGYCFAVAKVFWVFYHPIIQLLFCDTRIQERTLQHLKTLNQVLDNKRKHSNNLLKHLYVTYIIYSTISSICFPYSYLPSAAFKGIGISV